MSELKDQLRSSFKSKRLSFSKSSDLKAQSEAKICDFLLDLLTNLNCKLVGTYSALPVEVSLSSLNHQLEHVRWAYPRIKNSHLEFYDSNSEFEPNDWGVFEPKPHLEHYVAASELDCVLVPGVAFDNNGGRLGMGKSFYDRTLESLKAVKIGIGFGVQWSEEDLPLELHDIKMDYLVNENFILKPNIGKGS